MPALPQISVRRPVAALLCGLLMLLHPLAASAQGLIRDSEIEYALNQLLTPLAGAAGMGGGQMRVLVVNDSSMNAFVGDNQTIVMHSGLLLRLKTAQEVQAVLSHELAHIANGHLSRRIANLRSTNNIAKMALILSAAAAIGGADGRAVSGLAIGSTSTAQRLFLAHTRAEESSADQAGARYMAGAGIDPGAMLDVLELFRGQAALGPARQDPYVLTHPLSQDRIRALTGFAAAYGDKARPNPQADYWFARAQGKLGAFTQAPSYTLRKVAKGDNSDIAVMRRAIAYHRKPDPKAALREADRLVQMRHEDAFAHELRGQILLESRNFAPAVNAYARAVNLRPGDALILAGYGRSLLALDTADGNRKALAALEKARARDPYDPRMLRDLAVAYARAGNNGMASLSTAERYAVMGQLRDAAIHASRAAGLLPNGSPGWRRAQDILRAAKQAQ
ncbi:M48 family metalloprotease [Actibacterium sp. XHP0104]|uniref:M48 family metalloprotease n=1 Tax=Actibacterium sp. XHP0104 TaxID=2984335 RepID=UPI0021E890E2|nr:M48 family metalloprotease [Actibacterium sp. XHP0104]MCV2880810.1 M48 family metalloprotease [Actibacterium sp. XHP0104]